MAFQKSLGGMVECGKIDDWIPVSLNRIAKKCLRESISTIYRVLLKIDQET